MELVAKFQLVPDTVEDRARDADAARRSQTLQSRRDVHAIAENIVAFDNYITQVNTYTETNGLVLTSIRVASHHAFLNGNGARNRSNDGGKFQQ